MNIDPTITAAGTALIVNFITRGDLGPGKTLTDIWDVVLGNYFHALNEKSKAKYQQKIDEFKRTLGEKIIAIPENQVQDPKMSIVGPALEASKYYFDEKEIRNMFANLIASSMDSTYNGLVQHSFVEIIRQLSPYDAKLFNTLEEEFAINYKTKDIAIDSLNTEYTKLLVSSDLKASRGYNYKNEYFKDGIKNAISLSNLKRLGLIDFYESSELLKQNSYSIAIDEIDLTPPSNLCTITYCYITALGKAFKEVCIKDSL